MGWGGLTRLKYFVRVCANFLLWIFVVGANTNCGGGEQSTGGGAFGRARMNTTRGCAVDHRSLVVVSSPRPARPAHKR